MTDNQPNFEMLSAYVDGELDAAEAARMAGLIAANEQLARRVAQLSEMKKGVAGFAPDVVVLQVPSQSARTRTFAPLAAAVALFAVVLGSVIWIDSSPFDRSSLDQRSLISAALDEYDRSRGANALAVQSPAARRGFFAPELGAAGLSVAMVNAGLELSGNMVVHTVYVGQNGCRLSLFEFTESGGDEAFSMKSDGGLQHAWWTAGGSRYLAVARNMDDTRFAVVAGALKSMTIRKAQPDRGLLAQLRGARQPCLA